MRVPLFVFRPVALVLLLLIGGVLTVGMTEDLVAQETDGVHHYVPNELIIKFKSSAANSLTAEINRMAAEAGAVRMRRFSTTGAEHWRLGGTTSVSALLRRYQHDPRVEYVEPNYSVRISATPNDPGYTQGFLYGLDQISAPQAWDIQTGTNVVIGVIDTGVDRTHPDLLQNIWTNPGEIPNNGTDDDGNGFIDDDHGWDFVNNDNQPADDNGHGTHVAGTIAALGNNGSGVVGVNWRAQVMPLKFLAADGSGDVARAIAAIDYATENGARLTNNSWGGSGFSFALQDAISRANNAGSIFVAAAGNGGADGIGDNNDQLPEYPASYNLQNVISVAATDQNDQLAGFSNFGQTTVDLGAPGVDIVSTYPGATFVSLSGTSMATPHVSGVVALLFALQPNLSVAQVVAALLGNTDPVPSLQNKTVTGGRLNAFAALSSIQAPGNQPPSVSITAPQDNTTVADLLQVVATATDIDGTIARVTMHLPTGDQVATRQGATAQFAVSWDTTGLAAGSYALTATAVDDAGAATTSQPINIVKQVAPPPNQSPTVALIDPSNGDLLDGVVALLASAADPDGDATLDRVEFWLEPLLGGTAQILSVPYRGTQNFTQSVDTTRFPNGSLRLTVTAVDDSGAESDPVIITVAISNAGAGPTPLAITTAALPLVAVGQSLSVSLVATGGVPPYRWNLERGSLPNGLTGPEPNSGLMGGQPSVAGDYPILIGVTDAASNRVTKPFVLRVSTSNAVIVDQTGLAGCSTISADRADPTMGWLLVCLWIWGLAQRRVRRQLASAMQSG